ncbi:phosphocholine-specific phospholipase C [Swaminathania salitolerans]|uniref:phospholipase C n=1 Tax=Swaminathania salitolerans TaxID=182838 RepID=A0A511BP94_9PROT|nr:phospholipase C, phosphocholine-specific [Swaminathania salitolerans]GBQ13951.1 phospholipase C [Swaminathania salitolerans LMG 21291]GEL01683.1 phospholipase C, phosphocholine-specific [Swaminathania salitolerans]
MTPTRRRFLNLGAAALAGAALPNNLRKALAIPANRVTGTIRDVEHVVILMQENRSFDHYFGMLRGVRGFGDPRAERQPDGTSVFAQRDGNGRAIWPVRFDTVHTSAACLKSLDHSWKGSQSKWNEWDCWIPNKTAMTMGYFTRREIPYYYALADAFTICDAYHASIFGPTNPNRLYFFTGTNGLAVGRDGKQAVENVDDGNWSADMAHDNAAFAPFDWTTYPDRLQDGGVTWKIYQEYDNFGDNPLASFRQFRNLDRNGWRYRQARAIVPGSTQQNMHALDGRFLIEAFERDVASGALPQVSWIVPPAALSEHPEAPPGFGEHLISRLIDVFVRHPEIWSRTVFILNYDENDGFFDHVPPPVPDPVGESDRGNLLAGELYHGEPVGLGPRVPALMISPWSKGGWVNSQVFDHSSVIRFLEERFGVPCPEITPWRRAVCGDLTSAFDFSRKDPVWTTILPNTDAYLYQTRLSCQHPPPVLPERGSLPEQEEGQRPARALPYRLSVRSDASDARRLLLSNEGAQGAVLRIRQTGLPSRHVTLLPAETREFVCHENAPVTIYGPNGFYHFQHAQADLVSRIQSDDNRLTLTLLDLRSTARALSVFDHYARTTTPLTSDDGKSLVFSVALAPNDRWYHLDIVEEGKGCMLSVAGHVENGEPSRSDPRFCMGA